MKIKNRTTESTIERGWLPILILLMLITAAVGLRVYQLNAGLWLDEILTYVNYARLPVGEIITSYDSENQHFLYSLLAKLTFQIFKESNWALRLPAVIFGILSIPSVYFLGREVSNRREALLAAGLLTFSYHHVWFSQNARGYSGLLFWSILSSWLLLVAIRKNTLSSWVLYAITASLGVYTHLTMGFMILGQFFVYLYRILITRSEINTKWWKGLLFGFGGIGFLTIIMHAPVLSQMLSTIGGSEVSVVSEWKNPLWTLWEIFEGLNIGLSNIIFVLGALILFAVGVISYLRSRLEVDMFLVIPSVIGAAVVVAVGHHLWPRFFFFVFGFGVLVLIRGTMRSGEMVGRLINLSKVKSTWLGTGLCIGLILVSAASVPFAYGPKQDYQGAYNYLLSQTQEGDSVVSFDLAGFVYDEFYKTDWQMIESAAEFKDVLQQSKRTWVVFTFKPVSESLHPELMERIQAEFQLVQTFEGTVGEGTIYIYLSEGPSG